MSHFPRVPVRFLESNAELLKSQAEVDTSKVQKGYMNREDAMVKSQEVLSGGHADAGTDYKPDMSGPPGGVSAPSDSMRPQFRAPRDRNISNVLFRRTPDGELDMEAAKQIVVDAVHHATEKAVPGDLLDDIDRMVLSVFFPSVFCYIDPMLLESMASVHLRLAEHEIVAVRVLVAAHLRAEMSYNAGLGGMPTPHRRA